MAMQRPVTLDRAHDLLTRAIRRPGTGRFALGTGIVAIWLVRVVATMSGVPFDAMGPFADSAIGPIHPFVSMILGSGLLMLAAWFVRGMSPAAGWLGLLLSLQSLESALNVAESVPNMSAFSSYFFLYGMPAAMAVVAALYASEPSRRLGRWVTPLVGALIVWFWLAITANIALRTSVPPYMVDPLPSWYPLVTIAREGWIPGLIILLGIAGDARPLITRLRAWERDRDRSGAVRRSDGPPARWFRAGLLLSVGLLAASVVVVGAAFVGALPLIVVVVELILVALVLRHRLRPIAWLLLWAASFLAALLVGGYAVVPPDISVVDAVQTVALVFGAYGLVLLVGTLFASEPGRRLGGWVLPAGVALTVWLIVGGVMQVIWLGSLLPTEVESTMPWWVALAAYPSYNQLVLTLLIPPLVGLVGQLRDPWLRTAASMRRDGAPASRWPGMFLDELLPGRVIARQAATQAERVRFAADIHAELLPSLNLAIAESAAGASPERIADRLRELETEVRGLAGERRLVILEEFGIVEALEWLAERAEDRSPVTVDLVVQPAVAEGRPPRDVERGAFRVAQLAVDNALLHAQSVRITIDVRSEPSLLRLRVEDDGRGMAPGDEARASRANHQGLADMRLEADRVRARLDIVAAPPGGTVVLFDWIAR